MKRYIINIQVWDTEENKAVVSECYNADEAPTTIFNQRKNAFVVEVEHEDEELELLELKDINHVMFSLEWSTLDRLLTLKLGLNEVIALINKHNKLLRKICNDQKNES